MYDPTIHTKTMARHVRKADFAADNTLYNRANLNAIIEQAVQIGTNGFQAVPLKINMLRGKAVYQLSNLADALVVRHITSNIRRVTRVKQDDRQFIVTCMKKILSEGLPFRVYKFDIASFYERVSQENILKQLESDTGFSGQSIRALRSLFIQLDAANVTGLPRGMSLSATLAEYLLRSLDKFLSNTRGVWFYARFVDDMVVITDGKEDPVEFWKLAADKLPSGLEFNKKSTSLNFAQFVKTNTNVPENSFDFLGYRFCVSQAYRDSTDKKIKRSASLDIAPSKIRKLKTRIAKSLLAYASVADFDLLRDRIRLLTSNFHFTEMNSGIRRTSGIYFNYPLISADMSAGLDALDRFLVSAVTSPHPKNRLRPSLTNAQRRQLLNLRFMAGFKNKRFFAFSTDRLAELTRCWAYA
jgi:hypothetical protein